MARYAAEGEAAFEPRFRRPRSSPRATAPDPVELVLRLRKQLADSGLDAGADTIGWHLTHRHQLTLSRATIHRILTRAGAVVPESANRPRPPTRASPPSNPTRPCRPTSPTTRLTTPTGDPAATT